MLMGNQFHNRMRSYLAQCNLVPLFGRKAWLFAVRGDSCPAICWACSSRPSFSKVYGDAGCPPSVTSNGGEKAGRLGPLSNRSPGVVPIKSSSGHCRSSRINALEQWLAAPKPCCLNVFVQDLLEQMMHRHFVLLATFFVESQPAAGAIVIVIIDFEFGMGRELHLM
jgi:hypothetical protein